MVSPIKIYRDRAGYKDMKPVTYGISVVAKLGNRGITVSSQFRGYDKDNFRFNLRVFVFGTFLGVNPHGWGYWARKCCSNGIILLYLCKETNYVFNDETTKEHKRRLAEAGVELS